MNPIHISKVFEEYLKTPSQFALMINGTWGCGKTYFWKGELTSIATKNHYEPVYISLNGISSVKQLEQKLFLKLIPFLSKQENSTTRITTAIFKKGLDILVQKFTGQNLNELLKEISVDTFDFSKHVLCFDDLERCEMPIKETLGFINNFVEHKGVKTILLAHETNIEPKDEGYQRIKEKVIGRTLHFGLSISETAPLLYKKYKGTNASFFEFLRSNSLLIESLLVEYEEKNLRIISFILEIIEKIFPVLKDYESEYQKQALTFALIISVEFKKGGLTSSQFNTPPGIDEPHFYISFSTLTKSGLFSNQTNEKEKKVEPKYSEIFYHKYIKDRGIDYHFFQSIYSFILSGYFEPQLFQAEINKLLPQQLPEEIIDSQKLASYDFRLLENDEFGHTLTKVLNHIKAGKYKIYDYVFLSRFLFYFVDNKIIKESVSDIEKIILEGLEIAKSRNSFEEQTYQSLKHFGEENVNARKIWQIVINLHQEQEKRQYASLGQQFIDSIKKPDDETLREMIKEQRFEKEFLQNIEIAILFETLIRSPNKQFASFSSAFGYRYHVANIGEFLYEDKIKLEELQTKLEKHISENLNLGQPRKFLFDSFISELKQICANLEATKKS